MATDLRSCFSAYITWELNVQKVGGIVLPRIWEIITSGISVSQLFLRDLNIVGAFREVYAAQTRQHDVTKTSGHRKKILYTNPPSVRGFYLPKSFFVLIDFSA